MLRLFSQKCKSHISDVQQRLVDGIDQLRARVSKSLADEIPALNPHRPLAEIIPEIEIKTGTKAVVETLEDETMRIKLYKGAVSCSKTHSATLGKLLQRYPYLTFRLDGEILIVKRHKGISHLTRPKSLKRLGNNVFSSLAPSLKLSNRRFERRN